MRVKAFLGLLSLLLTPGTWAAPAGIVEGLQMPAWVAREGTTAPLKPGMELQAGDRLSTGRYGRLRLRLAEGSQVKLGEGADFRISRFQAPAQEDVPFKGLLRVVKGAFRFTTSLLSKRHRRSIDVQIATVTAGIRGTDLWGKAANDKDIVCLIEGQIVVRHGDDAPITMSDPLTFYIAPKDAPPLPVKPVSEAQLKTWADQTELTPGEGIATTDGRWTTSLLSVRDRSRATSALRRLHMDGYAAEVAEVTLKDQTWYRVVVHGFVDRHEALAFAARMNQRKDIEAAWTYPSR